MKASLYYDEIIEFIEKKYLIRIDVSTVDERTIEVGCKPAKFLPTITVKLRVAEVGSDIITLEYDCNSAIAYITNGIVTLLYEKIPNGVSVDVQNKRVIVYPHKIEELKKALEYVALSDVFFDSAAANFTVTLV